MRIKIPFVNKPYLLLITNLFCNFKCSYCIQTKSSLDVRYNAKKINVPAVLEFLKHNRIDHSVKLMGGESTIHPDFEQLMDGLLGLYRKVTITTNLNGLWYKKFDITLSKIQTWGRRIKWNTTFHPDFMEADLYIERIRAFRDANINVSQVATTDTPNIDPKILEKLNEADIGWKLQTFTGRNPEGQLLPRTWSDINTDYPQLYNPAKYIENYDEYINNCEDANLGGQDFRDEWVNCKTSRFLIGPDNNVYPCHRHLYVQDERYVCGSIHDVKMKNFKRPWHKFSSQWVLPCSTKCNPCDFKSVIIESTGRPNLIKGDTQPITFKSAVEK